MEAPWEAFLWVARRKLDLADWTFEHGEDGSLSDVADADVEVSSQDLGCRPASTSVRKRYFLTSTLVLLELSPLASISQS